jgi:CO/xanthine dehydrogenase Mo-binding subunit
MTANPSLKASPNVDDWIAIDAAGRVHVRSGKVDIGQRISTAVAIIAAEELEVAAADIIVEARQTGVTPDEGVTAGSNSILQSGHAIRRAAATARRHLLDQAARHFGTDVAALRIDDGLIRDPATNKTMSFKELAGGKSFGIPVDADVELKAPATYTQIGKPATPRDAVGQVTGRTVFLHDMVMDGMWHARVVRPPHSKARLSELDGTVHEKLAAQGLAIVRDGSFLAVAGADEFAVIKAAERLATTATWDGGPGLDETDIFTALTANDRLSFPVIAGTPEKSPVPDLPEPPADAANTLAARYERPYQMHGSIGPSAAMAVTENGKITIWTHSQGIYPLRDTIAEALGLNADDITIHHVLGSGCYGHNGADDAAFEAVLVARTFPGRPILLKWTREDEHAWEPYASAMAIELRASLNAAGQIIDWSGDAYSDTHMGRPRKGPDNAGPARLLASRFREQTIAPWLPSPNFGNHGGIHRNLDPYYTFTNRRLVKHLVRDLPHRTSSMRCLGAVANIFALESFMDELADAAGMDAVQFRLNHLDDERARAVLAAAAEGIGWRRTGLVDGHGQGIAFARYKNTQTYAAVAVDLHVDDEANVHLARVFIAADSGEVIDADGLKAQLEGGFMQAASWALYEQVIYDRDGITSRDWESYPILKFDNVPDIEVRLLDRPGDESLGAGEATSGPSVAAIANAIHDATTLRLRRMPFNPDTIRAAAMADDDG